MHILIIAALSVVALATPVHAQIHVDIGFHFPGPPPLVVVPETPRVQYVPPVAAAPADAADLFFYNGQYWAFANGGWFVGPGYNGPWIVVAPSSCLALSCSYQRGITMPPLDTGAGGKPANLRAGMRSMGVSGRTSASGEAASGRTNKARIEGTDAGETDSVSTNRQRCRAARCSAAWVHPTRRQHLME
jgi:hypothetical protein